MSERIKLNFESIFIQAPATTAVTGESHAECVSPPPPCVECYVPPPPKPDPAPDPAPCYGCYGCYDPCYGCYGVG